MSGNDEYVTRAELNEVIVEMNAALAQTRESDVALAASATAALVTVQRSIIESATREAARVAAEVAVALVAEALPDAAERVGAAIRAAAVASALEGLEGKVAAAVDAKLASSEIVKNLEYDAAGDLARVVTTVQAK